MAKKTKPQEANIFSTLNLAVILIALAFLIGNYDNLTFNRNITANAVSVTSANDCGFFCRLGNIISGKVVAEVQQGGISCSVTSSSACPSTSVRLIDMSDTTNAHAALPENAADSKYGYSICCTGDGLQGILNADITTTGTYTIFKLSNAYNAHVGLGFDPSASAYKYLARVKMPNFQCISISSTTASGTAACNANPPYSCIATLSGTDNAHIASCDSVIYPIKVCCKAVAPATLPTCTALGGLEYNSTLKCFPTPGQETKMPGIEITTDKYNTGALGSTMTKCCNGTVYEQYDPNIISCLVNITGTGTDAGKYFCLLNQKSPIDVAKSCQDKGGIFFGDSLQYCKANSITLPMAIPAGYECCNATSGIIEPRACADPARGTSKGIICPSAALWCPDNNKIAANDSADCCPSIDKCQPIATKTLQSCSSQGGISCNITAGINCREPIAAGDNINGMQCCKVACNNASLALTSCPNPTTNLCNVSLGFTCAAANWINSTQDNSSLGLQCCNSTCSWQKCADINPSVYGYFQLCSASDSKICLMKNQIISQDTNSSQQCCKGTCLLSQYITGQLAPAGCTPNCAGKACGASDGCNGICQAGTCANGLTCISGVCSAGAPPIQPATCANLPAGTRSGSQYCDAITKAMTNQKAKGDSCANDYECTSNFCQDGKCTSLSSTLDLIPRIWCLLSAWITYPASADSRTLDACDCMCGFFSNNNKHPYIVADCGANYACPA